MALRDYNITGKFSIDDGSFSLTLEGRAEAVEPPEQPPVALPPDAVTITPSGGDDTQL